MIEFSKVQIKNFMSIGEAEVDLDRGGFTLISGENHRVEDATQNNGSGKSSVIESICWVLTGETIRGHKEVVNRYTTGDCSVKLFFSFKGHNWAVERRMSRDKEKSLDIYKDGNQLQAKGYRDACDVLSKELPELTFKFINSVIILGQGLPGRFTNNTPAGRKAVLEELTNADFMINQVKEKISARKAGLDGELRVLEDKKLSDSSARAQLNALVESLHKDLDKLESFNLEKAMAELKEVEDKGRSKRVFVDGLQATIQEENTKKASLEEQLRSTKKEYSDKADRIKDVATSELETKRLKISKEYDDKISSLEKEEVIEISKAKEETNNKFSELIKAAQDQFYVVDEKIKEADNRVSHLNSIINNGVCPTCGQKLGNITQEELDRSKAELAEVNVNRENLGLERTELLNKLKDLKDSLASDIDSFVESIKLKFSEQIGLLMFGKENQLKGFANEFETELLKKLSELTEERMKKISSLEADLQVVANNLSKMNDDYRNNKVILESLREEYSSLKFRIDSYNKEKEGLERSLKESQEKIFRLNYEIENVIKGIEDKTKRIEIVKKMETFASRDFRGILLEEVIHRLDTILKGYAQLVYGNQLTSFYQEGNAIIVGFDGKEYESLSGGEQQKLNVLLQLSLRDLIVELTGVSGSILVLDEVFDGLDLTGCEKMISLFQTIDTSIFIISHHADSLNIPYDYKITVVKEENGVASLIVD